MSVYFEDHSIEADHGRRSLRAGAVNFSARVLITVIQLLTLLVLARLLSPEDYGLVGMVTAITVFAPLLVSLGTPEAVVQRARITEKEISALFWINVAVGCGVAALMAACGPKIARFYGEPRLTWITEVSALTFVVSALSCQHNTLLRRAMKFKELAAVEVSSNLLSAGGAITMALYGLEYWALVAETGDAKHFHCVRSLASMSLGARASCDVGWREGNAATGTPRCELHAHRFYRGFK